jgi:integrase
MHLHDICYQTLKKDWNTLDKLLESLRLSGKGKRNVMICFHAFLDYAWRAKRIPEIPPFPKRSDYKIVAPSIKWLPSERQVKVIEAIPEIHQPIFWFLKYHSLPAAGQACALHKCDYDIINKVFIIRRSMSARQVVKHTKTDHEHIIPCHRNMVELIDHLARQPRQYLFENPRAWKDGKRYTLESLNILLWRQACKDTGENIDIYSGLKHSSCSQLVNEMVGTLSDLHVLTDHARLDSVRRYAETQIARKRELIDSSGKDLAGLLKVVK